MCMAVSEYCLAIMALAFQARRILFVEDNDEIRRTIVTFLSDYQFTEAATVAEGWNHFKARKFSLVLLDVGLSDGSGLHLCKRMRSVDGATPIIVLSSNHSLTQEEIEEVGAQIIIKKGCPNFISSLKSSIERFSVADA